MSLSVGCILLNNLFHPGNDIGMPKVEVSPPNQSVSEGENAMFYCNASGFPTPRIQWVTGKFCNI